MKAVVACVLALAGCQETDPLYCGKHPADLDNCPRPGCFGMDSLGLLACATATPPGPIAIGVNTVMDTTAGVSSPPGLTCAPLDSESSAVCLLEGTTIAIATGATLYATGARPLVLATAGSIDIAGTLDVASLVGVAVGAAGDSTDCMPATVATAEGGGAGGSFTTGGGNGGDQAMASGTKALAGVTITWSSLRGGCKGSSGAGSGGIDNSGHGGGAVALLGTSIAIEGTLDASGSAGGAGHYGGGGGGGSGGMIALQARTLTLDPAARIFANGSHGGGGATLNDGTAGTDPISPDSGGGGGVGADGGIGGMGGEGYPSSARAGGDSMVNPGTGMGAGGGGGGGGAGVIVTHGAQLPAMNVSPPATSK